MAVFRILEDFDPQFYFSVVWKGTQIQLHHHRMTSVLQDELSQITLDNIEDFGQRYYEVIENKTRQLITDHRISVETRFVNLMNYWIMRLTDDFSDLQEVNKSNRRVVRRLKKILKRYRQQDLVSALGLLFEYEERDLMLGIKFREKFQDVVKVGVVSQRI